jgi:small subunit ribosomal protein S16
MLKIRLFRVGKKNQPAFKIVVTDKKNPPKSGRFIEEVGFWNPLIKQKVFKKDRIKYWLSVGAKPSETIHNLLVSEKIIEGKKIMKHKKPKKKEPSSAKATEGQGKKKEEVTVPAETKKAEEKPEEIKEVKTEEKPKEEKVEEGKKEVLEQKKEPSSSKASEGQREKKEEPEKESKPKEIEEKKE